MKTRPHFIAERHARVGDDGFLTDNADLRAQADLNLTGLIRLADAEVDDRATAILQLRTKGSSPRAS